MTRRERTDLLKMADDDLLQLCRVTVARGSGRGGQKRNRTESAVRVTHEASGITTTCDQSRSQQTNRKLALRKLRLEIALSCRCVPDTADESSGRPGRKSAEYPLWVADILDVLAAHNWRVSDAASEFGQSTGRFVRDLASDADVWQAVNSERERHGYPKLRM